MDKDGLGRFVVLSLPISLVVLVALLTEETTRPRPAAPPPATAAGTFLPDSPPAESATQWPSANAQLVDWEQPVAAAETAPDSLRPAVSAPPAAWADLDPQAEAIVADIVSIREAVSGDRELIDMPQLVSAASPPSGEGGFEVALREAVVSNPPVSASEPEGDGKPLVEPPVSAIEQRCEGAARLLQIAWQLDGLAHELELEDRYHPADGLRAVATNLRQDARRLKRQQSSSACR